MNEADNHLRWNGRPGHYEVYYLTFNDRPTRTGFWIRYTMEAPLAGHGLPHAELWFAFFDAAHPLENFALRRKTPISALLERRDPWSVHVEKALLSMASAEGTLEGGGHAASWQLAWDPAPGTFLHLPDKLYRSRIAQTKVLSPNLSVRVSGRIVVDGREISLRDEPCCQTHLWGRKHAYAWAWAHCNAFREDADAVVEAVSARLKRGRLVLPPITLFCVRTRGEELRFREIWQAPFCRASWETGRYRFAARTARTRVECEFRCRVEDLVRADYADPDGEPSCCHNSEVADARVVVWRRKGVGWHEVAHLTASGAGHFEYAGRTPDPHVERAYVVLDSG